MKNTETYKHPTYNLGDPKGRRYREKGQCSICAEKSIYKVLISGKGYVEFCKNHKKEASELSARVTRRLNILAE